MKTYYIYITTNPGKTTLYTGITSNLNRRIWQHQLKRGKKDSFAGKYYCYNLIYYEVFNEITQAFFREKEIKNMSRFRKIRLIELKNPSWRFNKDW